MLFTIFGGGGDPFEMGNMENKFPKANIYVQQKMQ